jgi:hypothetical protein
VSDPFYDIDPGQHGYAELRRRRTIDHEACHVAAAVALGWDVSSVEIDPDGASGSARFAPPPGLPVDRALREQLAITVAPRVVLGGDGGRSGGDSSDAWQLAQKVAAGGDGGRWCYVTPSETRMALYAAECEATRLADTPRFRHARYVVCELVANLGTIGRLELDAAVRSATELTVLHLAERRADELGELVG